MSNDRHLPPEDFEDAELPNDPMDSDNYMHDVLNAYEQLKGQNDQWSTFQQGPMKRRVPPQSREAQIPPGFVEEEIMEEFSPDQDEEPVIPKQSQQMHKNYRQTENEKSRRVEHHDDTLAAQQTFNQNMNHIPQNPLSKYFRQPGIEVRLPSNGKYYSPQDVRVNQFGQVSIKPLSAADELLLKSPDGLFNGESLAEAIVSCCPNVTNPRVLVTPDIDAILLGIRIATYGDTMEFTEPCPKCNQSGTYEVDIREMLAKIEFLEDEYWVKTKDGLEIEICPYNYDANTRAALSAYQEARYMQSIQEDNSLSEEEKMKRFRPMFHRMANLQKELTTLSILRIVTPEKEVIDNKEFIAEFVANTDRRTFKEIQDVIQKVNQSFDKRLKVVCEHCGHERETEINFDPASFFE